eukprot:553345-Rhodomonas_salina.3
MRLRMRDIAQRARRKIRDMSAGTCVVALVLGSLCTGALVQRACCGGEGGGEYPEGSPCADAAQRREA